MAPWRKVLIGMSEDLSSNPREVLLEETNKYTEVHFSDQVGRKVEEEGRKVEMKT